MVNLTPATLLRAENLTKTFAQKSFWARKDTSLPAAQNVSLEIKEGQTVGLVGESGSGKSTLCRMLLRLEEPTSGAIYFREQEITQASGASLQLFRRSVQAVFQDPYGALNPHMRIGDVLEEPFTVFGLHKDKHERRAAIEKLMQQVGLLPAMLDRYPSQFSGGQRQRICIARALALKPSIIIADEPITALDVSIQAQIVNLFQDLQDELGLAFLFVSHDLNMVRHLCDEVVVMYRGSIVERGPTESVFKNPQHPYTASLLGATPVPDPDAPFIIRTEATQT
jgi:ABC-type oligopeptide transport system ATPase subunit